jgi:hypothetical protein
MDGAGAGAGLGAGVGRDAAGGAATFVAARGFVLADAAGGAAAAAALVLGDFVASVSFARTDGRARSVIGATGTTIGASSRIGPIDGSSDVS